LANLDASLLIWIVGVVRTIGALPHARIIVTPPSAWAIALYDAALLVAAYLLSRKRVSAATAIFSCACVLLLWHPGLARHELAVTAIDVGQADALLVRTPHGHAFLVDAGGRLERGSLPDGESPAEAVGERVVVPFLIRSGVRHLDGILLSHPHGDHAGGVAPVLRTLGAGVLADSGQQYPGHAYHDALLAARERGTPVLEARGGDVWSTEDGVRFRFYGPIEPYLSHTYNDINNNSLVFRVEYGHFRMLFTGDAGEAAEKRMLESGDDLRADVLKVGHHGSAYSSSPAFLAAVHPSAAIISVGRHNLFGHPSERALSALQAVGARVYRTDEDGAITIRSDGEHTSIEPFLRRQSSPNPLHCSGIMGV
jgi:competence protein ComEC